ncbi:MAG: hypothetical protein ACKOD9_17675, partial [Rubrivivax sp.]
IHHRSTGMNVKRFTARKSRDALKQVRQVLGQDAIVLSTRPCPDGVEVLAMAPESVQQFERVAVAVPRPSAALTEEAPRPGSARSAAVAGGPSRLAARAAAQGEALGRASSALRERLEPSFDAPAAASASARQARDLGQEVNEDVQQLSMSTLSFQDYVRERMLRRRKAELEAAASIASKSTEEERPVTVRRQAGHQLAGQRRGETAVQQLLGEQGLAGLALQLFHEGQGAEALLDQALHRAQLADHLGALSRQGHSRKRVRRSGGHHQGCGSTRFRGFKRRPGS